MDIIGQAISHKIFGTGVVTSVTDRIVTVRFQGTEKNFIYPDAFAAHLVFLDTNHQHNMKSRLAAREAKLNAHREEERRALARRRRINNFTVSSNSHAVFNISAEHETQVRADCAVSTGQYQSGSSKGRFRVADKLKPNSACLLTVRSRGALEQERGIFGIFMVKPDFFGEDSSDGRVEAHPEHRLMLPAGEYLPLWRYFPDDAVPRWGNTAFKYCSCPVMSLILSDILQKLEDTPLAADALAFYRYFCRINRLPAPAPPDADSEAAV